MIKNFNEILASGELDVNGLESYRLEKLAELKEDSKKVGLIIGGIALVLLIITLITKMWLILILVAIAGIVFLIRRSSKKKKILIGIKNGLIKKLVTTANESFNYEPERFIPKDLFKKSKIIRSFNTYSGEDFFSGTINNIPIQFSEITVQVKNDKRTTTVFKGPFFVVQFPQTFAGETTVVHDYLEKNLGGLGRALQKMNLSRLQNNLIKIDNKVFEEYFAVYTKNEPEARKILSDNLCSLLISEREKHGKVYFSFNNNNFYFGIDNRRDIFHVNVDSHISENSLRKHYDEFVDYINLILTIYSMIEENMQSLDFSTNNIPQKDNTPPPKEDDYNKVKF